MKTENAMHGNDSGCYEYRWCRSSVQKRETPKRTLPNGSSQHTNGVYATLPSTNVKPHVHPISNQDLFADYAVYASSIDAESPSKIILVADLKDVGTMGSNHNPARTDIKFQTLFSRLHPMSKLAVTAPGADLSIVSSRARHDMEASVIQHTNTRPLSPIDAVFHSCCIFATTNADLERFCTQSERTDRHFWCVLSAQLHSFLHA